VLSSKKVQVKYEISKELLDLGRYHLVKATYGHERLHEAVNKLARRGRVMQVPYMHVEQELNCSNVMDLPPFRW
jgi:hypothetical protein